MNPGTKGWYWLDAAYDGAKAVSKEVWMPYMFQNEKPGSTRGKWVRYDEKGAMVKGWYSNADGRRLYYDPRTGAMVNNS